MNLSFLVMHIAVQIYSEDVQAKLGLAIGIDCLEDMKACIHSYS